MGSGGVGKVYSGSISKSGKNNTIDSWKRYTAVVAYASTWDTVTVNYNGGTFTIKLQHVYIVNLYGIKCRQQEVTMF